MAILVRNLHGVLGGLNVRSNDTVDELKSKIEELEGIPAHKMRLIYAGKQLEDDSLLSDYHIQRVRTHSCSRGMKDHTYT